MKQRFFVDARNFVGARYSVILLKLVFILTFSGQSISQDQTKQFHQQARELIQTAAEAMAEGNYKLVLDKAQRVAQLLPDDPRVQQRAAELLYRSGYPKESLPLFQRANELSPDRAADNWQRGIALATAGDFQQAASQFETHHKVNPDDVENSAWYFLCVAKTADIQKAEDSLIPSRGDRRPPMMSILKMLKREVKPEQVLETARSVPAAEQNSALFYAELYVGLYYDALGDSQLSQEHLKRCVQMGMDGYMADTARVYLHHRFDHADSTDGNARR
ncbi:MAG TPA: hypothetical protein DCF63_11060 [Planctomycetaceae bacterium]|nr:hypothetical protein [Planctomycetaceae bacterium]